MILSWVIYFLLNIICYFLVIMYGQYEMYFAWRMIFIIPLVFLIIMVLNRLLIKYDSKIVTSNVIKGDKVHYEFTIINNGIFSSGQIRTFIEVYYGECLRQKFSVDCIALPMEKRKHSIELVADYSGCMTIVRKKVKLYDYLRLFSVGFGKKNIENSLMVMPKICPVDVEIMDTSNLDLIETDRYHSSKKGNDKSEIFDVREYVEGDQIRDIHWKLSMKYDKYMIKEYSLPINTDLDIIIDCNYVDGNMNSIAKKDKLMEVLCSVSADLLSKEIAFYINVANGKDGNVERTFVENEDALYMAMGIAMETNKYSGNKKKIVDTISTAEMLKCIEKKNVLLLTSNLTEEMMAELALNYHDKKIVLIYPYAEEKKTNQIKTIPENVKFIGIDAGCKGMGDIHEIRF